MVAADVPDDAVTVDDAGPDAGPGQVRLADAGVPVAWVAAVLVDDPAAASLVAAAAGAVVAADDGDADAEASGGGARRPRPALVRPCRAGRGDRGAGRVTTGWDAAEAARVHARLVDLAGDLPGCEVEDSHGHTGFVVRGKRAAWLLVDHHGDGRLGLWVKAPPGEQQALVGGDPGRYYVPPYMGVHGWVAAHVDAAHDPDWHEVAALLEQAWRLTAGKRAVAAYDATHPSRA